MSLPLQMMPGGSVPSTGWDWGAWTLMSLVAVIAAAGVVVIVVFLLRYERRPVASVYAPQQTQSSLGPTTVQVSSSTARPGSDVMGRVVLSLAPTLMDDERRVMDEMARAGGEVLQSDLPKMTTFSKSTVSKAIHSLEVRGIVVREKHKWTYWCKVNPRLVERTLQSDPIVIGSPDLASA